MIANKIYKCHQHSLRPPLLPLPLLPLCSLLSAHVKCVTVTIRRCALQTSNYWQLWLCVLFYMPLAIPASCDSVFYSTRHLLYLQVVTLCSILHATCYTCKLWLCVLFYTPLAIPASCGCMKAYQYKAYPAQVTEWIPSILQNLWFFKTLIVVYLAVD